MKEILPGVYQSVLPLSGFSPGSVNVYLLISGGEFCLIDTGWNRPECVQSFTQQLSEAGIEYSRIRQVVTTHCHIDHLGLIGKFKRDNGARIYLPEDERELIRLRFTGRDNYIPMTDAFLESFGVPLSELAPPDFVLPQVDLVEPDVSLRGGEELRVGDFRLNVVNTPGHTPGHVAFYEPSRRWLFAGDVLLPTIATNAAFHVQHMLNPLQQYLNSLRTLRQMEIQLVLPGHEYPFSRYRERIDELIEHHQRKDREILAAFADKQAKTAYQISQIISWSPKNRLSKWTQLSGWDKRFAMLQTIAHLEELVGIGRLARFCRDGKIYYS